MDIVIAPPKRTERRTNETYYKSRVVSNLFFVTTNDWELTDKLKSVTDLITYFDGNEWTYLVYVGID